MTPTSSIEVVYLAPYRHLSFLLSTLVSHMKYDLI